jgi:hypothetical protein
VEHWEEDTLGLKERDVVSLGPPSQAVGVVQAEGDWDGLGEVDSVTLSHTLREGVPLDLGEIEKEEVLEENALIDAVAALEPLPRAALAALAVAHGVAEKEGDTLEVTDPVLHAEPVALPLREGESVGVEVKDPVAVEDPQRVAGAEAVPVTAEDFVKGAVMEIVEEAEGEAVEVGEREGDAEGVSVTVAEGETVFRAVIVDEALEEDVSVRTAVIVKVIVAHREVVGLSEVAVVGEGDEVEVADVVGVAVVLYVIVPTGVAELEEDVEGVAVADLVPKNMEGLLVEEAEVQGLGVMLSLLREVPLLLGDGVPLALFSGLDDSVASGLVLPDLDTLELALEE